MLFIDLDETLIRSRDFSSLEPEDLFVTDLEPVPLSLPGFEGEFYIRPDLEILRVTFVPFVIFSAGSREYVKTIANYLRDNEGLNIRGWLSRNHLADKSPDYPVTTQPSVLIEDRPSFDPIAAYKMARLPNGLLIQTHKFGWRESTNTLEIQHTHLSNRFFVVVKEAMRLLGLPRITSRKIGDGVRVSLRRPFILF